MARKFVRFIVDGRERVSGVRLGFFGEAYRVRNEVLAPPEDRTRLAELLEWFKENLAIPDRFARSGNRHAHGKGLSWFKPDAIEHITKAREITDIVERCGIRVEMRTTSEPGYVIYEDQFQICAQPFREDSPGG